MAREHHTPTDNSNLTALAAVAFAPGAMSAADRDELIAKLMGPLWGFAWKIARPDHDLAEELRAHVLLRCQEGCYDPALGAFGAWARTVMSRSHCSLVKSRGRAVGGDYPERIDACADEADGDDRTAPFTPDDLARIRRWKSPLKRVLLLTQSLLWRKYPAELWRADLAALGLPPDLFPCPEFEDMTRAERNAYLARVLGVPRNTIHVRMNRWAHQLHELRFVLALAGRL